jgi:hypothetical protein
VSGFSFIGYTERRLRLEQTVTFADIKLWAGRWCCRWCRAKALRICDIEHEAWCRVLTRASPEETRP